MIEKKPKLIITFDTVTAAMAMESACAAGDMPGRLIPVPREISAGCGMAWSAPLKAEGELREFVRGKGITVKEWHILGA